MSFDIVTRRRFLQDLASIAGFTALAAGAGMVWTQGNIAQAEPKTTPTPRQRPLPGEPPPNRPLPGAPLPPPATPKPSPSGTPTPRPTPQRPLSGVAPPRPRTTPSPTQR